LERNAVQRQAPEADRRELERRETSTFVPFAPGRAPIGARSGRGADRALSERVRPGRGEAEPGSGRGRGAWARPGA